MKNIKLIFSFLLLLFAVSIYAQSTEKEEEPENTQGPWYGKTNSRVHFAGYGFVNYDQPTSDDGSSAINMGFNPIFHYSYQDLAMLEAELEFEVDEDGNTKTGIDYAAIDLFLTDYITVVAGKFLSPLGFFRQNLHPSWINRLPKAPAGFGHDGAAPVSEMGIQLRGGIPFKDMRLNYAVYVGNGPTLGTEAKPLPSEEEPELAQEGIGEKDLDKSKSVGGRIGFMPLPIIEIGASFAKGKVHLVDSGALNGPERDLQIFGVDLNYNSTRIKGLRTRAEYIQTDVTGVDSSFMTPGSVKLAAWYAEVSYLTKWRFEPVLRYGQFSSTKGVKDTTATPVTVDDEDKKVSRITFGMNYYFAPTVVSKIAYSNEKTTAKTTSTEHKILLQLAYGF